MTPELLEVYNFAKNAHENQYRHAEVPYITHCIHVCDIVENFRNVEDFDLIVAQKIALLHDTIEDTNVSYNDVKNKFGKAVADGVLALTKNYNLDKILRLKDSLERSIKTSKETVIVKLADRADNIKIINPNWSKEKAISYLEDSKIIYSTLSPYAKNLIPFLNKSLSHYENLIKKYYK